MNKVEAEAREIRKWAVMMAVTNMPKAPIEMLIKHAAAMERYVLRSVLNGAADAEQPTRVSPMVLATAAVRRTRKARQPVTVPIAKTSPTPTPKGSSQTALVRSLERKARGRPRANGAKAPAVR